MARKMVSEEDFEAPEKSAPEKTVKYGDPDWHDYIMGKFTDAEKENGLPKCDGLRRMLFSEFDVIKSQRDFFDRTDGVTVGWVCQFIPRKVIMFDPNDPVLPTITVSSLASANPNNTKYPFSNYLEAVADTRAEARCYKKALLLRCLAAEETAENLAQTESQTAPGDMSEVQKKAIMAMCKNIGINMKGTLRFHEKEIAEGATPLVFERLSNNEAAKFMNVLNSYQCNAGKKVPPEIKEEK